MVNVVFFKDSSNQLIGFESRGHAGAGEYGEDIVCAAVSALVINTINSIEQLTDDAMVYESDEKTGSIICRLGDELSNESKILLSSLYLGIEAVKVDNEQYITLKIKEV